MYIDWVTLQNYITEYIFYMLIHFENMISTTSQSKDQNETPNLLITVISNIII